MSQLSEIHEFTGSGADRMPIKSHYTMKIKDFKKRYIQLNTIDLDSYNKSYFETYLEKINYNIYLGIHLLENALPIEEYKQIVDLGGGIGFNSALFAFLYPNKAVVYVDVDPVSAKSAELLNSQMGLTNITYLVGGLEEHVDQLTNESLLCSRDVIEHIYNLETFFKQSSKAKTNVHNTAAVLNSWLRRNEFKRIHKMAEFEGNTAKSIKDRDSRKPYFNQRIDIISKLRPDYSEEKLHEITALTRGLISADIKQYVVNGVLPNHHNKCLYSNTCDPNTGNWAERTLSKKDYQLYAGSIPLKFTYPEYNVAGARTVFKRVPLGIVNLFAAFTGKHEIQPSFSIVY
ncbi:MAG: hypothetical protein JXR19_05515 [Bacteroidia bacterium]